MTIKKLRIIEFLVIGLALGVLEDAIAIKSATGTAINFSVLKVAFIVALPFAILSELIVDHPDFWKKVMRFLKIDAQQVEKKIEKEIVINK